MCEFDTFLPAILDVGESDHVRVGRTFRVVALEFTRRVDAGKLQRRDAFRNLGVDLSA